MQGPHKYTANWTDTKGYKGEAASSKICVFNAKRCSSVGGRFLCRYNSLGRPVTRESIATPGSLLVPSDEFHVELVLRFFVSVLGF